MIYIFNYSYYIIYTNVYSYDFYYNHLIFINKYITDDDSELYDFIDYNAHSSLLIYK
jgi:hypothetical protein